MSSHDDARTAMRNVIHPSTGWSRRGACLPNFRNFVA